MRLLDSHTVVEGRGLWACARRRERAGSMSSRCQPAVHWQASASSSCQQPLPVCVAWTAAAPRARSHPPAQRRQTLAASGYFVHATQTRRAAKNSTFNASDQWDKWIARARAAARFVQVTHRTRAQRSIRSSPKTPSQRRLTQGVADPDSLSMAWPTCSSSAMSAINRVQTGMRWVQRAVFAEPRLAAIPARNQPRGPSRTVVIQNCQLADAERGQPERQPELKAFENAFHPGGANRVGGPRPEPDHLHIGPQLTHLRQRALLCFVDVDHRRLDDRPPQQPDCQTAPDRRSQASPRRSSY